MERYWQSRWIRDPEGIRKYSAHFGGDKTSRIIREEKKSDRLDTTLLYYKDGVLESCNLVFGDENFDSTVRVRDTQGIEFDTNNGTTKIRIYAGSSSDTPFPHFQFQKGIGTDPIRQTFEVGPTKDNSAIEIAEKGRGKEDLVRFQIDRRLTEEFDRALRGHITLWTRVDEFSPLRRVA